MAQASRTTRLDPSDIPPLVLGRYRVLEERGHGGFGTVSVCWDPRLMRRVAIKTIPLHPSGSAPDAADRQADGLLRAALAETRTASMLAHPNIVSMLDFEWDDACAYIIMEYVEGASLGELLDATDDGLLTFDEAAAVAEAVGDALSYAHENGVLHLDIKPDNILIDGSGRVRLADFGMATLSSATGYGGAVGGTVGYMPPEQITGGRVDVRTDVFAFATVMYEALTGVRPFAAATAEESLDLVCGVLADPCALNEAIPAQAADALLVALDPDPEMRPPSVGAFVDELRQGLGSSRAGRRSLAALVADVRDDEAGAQDAGAAEGAAGEAGSGEAADVAELGALARVFPRAPEVALRLLAGLSCGWLAALAVIALAQALGGAGGSPVPAGVAGGVVTGAIALAAPQLAGAIALAGLMAACVACRLWALAVPLLVVAGAWWAVCARREPLATGAPLAGSIGGQAGSAAPALLGAYALAPGGAALAALLSFAVALALCALAGAPRLGAFDPAAIASADAAQAAQALVSLVKNPATWASGVAWVAAAAAFSAIAHRGGFARCYLACFVALAIELGVGAAGARVENGGVWTPPTSDSFAAAATSFILMCAIVFLFGTPRRVFGAGQDGTGEGDPAEEGL